MLILFLLFGLSHSKYWPGLLSEVIHGLPQTFECVHGMKF